jgi:hypothetical protein
MIVLHAPNSTDTNNDNDNNRNMRELLQLFIANQVESLDDFLVPCWHSSTPYLFILQVTRETHAYEVIEPLR